MKVYGLKVAEGSQTTNLSVPHGISFPTNANDGELFLMMEPGLLPVLYTYVNSEWRSISVSGLGRGHTQQAQTYFNADVVNQQIGQVLAFDGAVWTNLPAPGFIRTLVTSDKTLASTDTYVGVRQTGRITLTLPIASENKVIVIKDELGRANKWPIKVVPHDNDTIDLKTEVSISSNFGSITLFFADNNWSII